MKKKLAVILSVLLVSGSVAGFGINAEDDFLLGDVNEDGVINASDAARVLVASANMGSGQESGLTDRQSILADYNQDGKVNALDASGILVYSAEQGAGLLKETTILPVHSYLQWFQLGNMTSHSNFRTEFNNLVTPDANDTLYTFLIKHYDFDTTQLIGAIQSEYSDINDTNADSAIWNTMFELLPSDSTTFNGGANLTRGQAMALVMRAITPVESDNTPNSNAGFTSAVGESVYTDYASYMDKNSFISSNSGLTEENFNTPMTRGEYIYLIINAVYGGYDIPDERVEFNDCKNGGLMDDCNDNAEKLAKSIDDPAENGVPSAVYYALANAKQYGIIGNDTNFDEELTLTDAVDLLSNLIKSKGESNGGHLPVSVVETEPSTEVTTEETTEETTTTTAETVNSPETTTTTVVTVVETQAVDPVQQEDNTPTPQEDNPPVQQEDNTPVQPDNPVVEQPEQNDPEPVYVEPVQTTPPVVETQPVVTNPPVVETQPPVVEPEPEPEPENNGNDGYGQKHQVYVDPDYDPNADSEVVEGPGPAIWDGTI